MSLSAQLKSDLPKLINSDEFAVIATYNGTQQIKVIFDDAFARMNFETDAVESSVPQAICQTSDLPSVVHGDTLLMGTTTYKIIGLQPDGTGLTTLLLSKD